MASLVAQMAKNLPAMQETWVWSVALEDPLEKGMITDSSILAWRIPRTEEPGGLQCMGSWRIGHDLATKQQQQQINKNTTNYLCETVLALPACQKINMINFF